MMMLILTTVRYAENSSRMTPTTVPVSRIANGRDRAPAPRVAEHRLLIEPGEWRRASPQHRFLGGIISPAGPLGTYSSSSAAPTSLLIPTSKGRVPFAGSCSGHEAVRRL
mmetsp:Transcript_24424/g.55323  ORF Transcript_24424/g.55323 Transcript_24424/m.55323 type:complete len:110 (-) Transcript_24424:234-563(-)